MKVWWKVAWKFHETFRWSWKLDETFMKLSYQLESLMKLSWNFPCTMKLSWNFHFGMKVWWNFHETFMKLSCNFSSNFHNYTSKTRKLIENNCKIFKKLIKICLENLRNTYFRHYLHLMELEKNSSETFSELSPDPLSTTAPHTTQWGSQGTLISSTLSHLLCSQRQFVK